MSSRTRPISKTGPKEERTSTVRVDPRYEKSVKTKVEKANLKFTAASLRKAAVAIARRNNPNYRFYTNKLVEQAELSKQAARRLPTISKSNETEEEYNKRKNRERSARNLAELHNNSFFGGMISPPINPDFAALNPDYMLLVFRSNALFLPETIATAVTMGGGPSMARSIALGAKQGWNVAGNYGRRALSATKLAGIAAGRASGLVVRSPKFWAGVGLSAYPTLVGAQEVYDHAEAEDVPSGSSSVSPYVYGGVGAALALGAGYGLYKFGRFRGGKAATNASADAAKQSRNLFKFERSPLRVNLKAELRALLDVYNTGSAKDIEKLKERLVDPTELAAAKKKAKRKFNIHDLVSDKELKKAILNTSSPLYKNIRGLETNSQRAWRIGRNALRLGAYGGIGGGAIGAINKFANSRTESGKKDLPQGAEGTQLGGTTPLSGFVPVDTIVDPETGTLFFMDARGNILPADSTDRIYSDRDLLLRLSLQSLIQYLQWGQAALLYGEPQAGDTIVVGVDLPYIDSLNNINSSLE